MKQILTLLLLILFIGEINAIEKIEGTWQGAIVGHVDNKDYFIKADLRAKKNGSNYVMKMKLYCDEYAGDFLLQLNLMGDKLNIEKITTISEYPYPYLHIEDCFSGYFLIKNDAKNKLQMDLYRNPVRHKVEEFTNLDGSGNFVSGFECFTTVILSKTMDKTNDAYARKTDSLISSKKNKSDLQAKRKVVSTKIWKVNSNQITLNVWDNNKVDGDIISLKLNDNWVLTNSLLKKEKHAIPISLKKRENELLLFAENLGSIPPNTAAVSIDDGTELRIFILNSDLGKSEMIKIILADSVSVAK
jgi:hypothetical protein